MEGEVFLIYLDNSAGARPYPEVIETITDVLQNHWGNASADNSFGQDARVIIDNVTQQVANDINCTPDEIIWTSGACEANSLAIMGIAHKHYTWLYTSKLEHTSINKIANGFARFVDYNHCSFIENNNDGLISLENLESQLKKNKNDDWHLTLVSISFANSEIGAIQDIKSIAEIVHQYDGILHVDATQMYPWHKIDVQDLGIDMMSVSGQKFHCVKGIGFLYVKDGIELNPLIYGSQQNERRGGSYPTHLIAAFGKALEITRQHNATSGVKDLRDYLLDRLLHIENVHLNGPLTNEWRLPNNISLTIDGVNASTLVTMCDLMGVIIAKGSACKSYEPEPSDTLLAIGLTAEQALSTIRISLDEFNSLKEVDEAADIITKLVKRIRNEEN